MHQLFTPYDLSGISLANRVVMAPMTRTRTLENNPDALTALYYAQRASAGLIVTEGLPVSDEGRGYLYTPGIYSSTQGQGWRQVTDAVHAKGGKIFAQRGMWAACARIDPAWQRGARRPQRRGGGKHHRLRLDRTGQGGTGAAQRAARAERRRDRPRHRRLRACGKSRYRRWL